MNNTTVSASSEVNLLGGSNQKGLDYYVSLLYSVLKTPGIRIHLSEFSIRPNKKTFVFEVLRGPNEHSSNYKLKDISNGEDIWYLAPGGLSPAGIINLRKLNRGKLGETKVFLLQSVAVLSKTREESARILQEPQTQKSDTDFGTVFGATEQSFQKVDTTTGENNSTH